MDNVINGKSYPKVVIYGDVASKRNQYRIITINGHASLKKSDAVKEFEKKFYLQNPLRGAHIDGFFEMYLDAYFSSNRKDLDGAFKLILDVLQSSGTIKNDRNCVKIVANKFIDKLNPRIEFTLVEVGGIEVRDSREPRLFG